MVVEACQWLPLLLLRNGEGNIGEKDCWDDELAKSAEQGEM